MAKSSFVTPLDYPGTKMLVLENDRLRIAISPEKGSDILEIVDKRSNTNVLYKNPTGFRRFQDIVPSIPTNESTFLDCYEGGWQDILPNPGGASIHRGASWALHAETPYLQWKVASQDRDNAAISQLSTECVRYPIRVQKTIELRDDEAQFEVTEEAINLAEQRLELAWLQHVVFADVLMADGMNIDLRAKEAVTVPLKQTRLMPNRIFDWPFAPASEGQYIDLSRSPYNNSHFEDEVLVTMAEPWYALRNNKMNMTIALTWSPNVYQHVWYWLNFGSLDYPWWGRSRSLGIEPCSSASDTGLAEYTRANTALILAEGSSIKSKVVFSVIEGTDSVKLVTADGKVIT